MVKHDVIYAIGALLAKDVKRCSRHLKKMCYLPSSQESFTTTKVIYTVTSSDGALGQCKYGFLFGVTNDPMQQRFDLCGGRLFLKDGLFYSFQQDQ